MQPHIAPDMRECAYRGQTGPDDLAIALALTTVWAIRTGRMLRPVPVSELTADELIAFWADDQIGENLLESGNYHEPRGQH